MEIDSIKDTVDIVSPGGRVYTVRGDAVLDSSGYVDIADQSIASIESSPKLTPDDLIPILTEAVAKMSSLTN